MTKKHLLAKAETAIDDLIAYINYNPEIKSATNIEGMEITRANKYNGSKIFNGHMSLLLNKHTAYVNQNKQNAWNKRRAQPTAEYYQPDDFPALPNAKAARHETVENKDSNKVKEDDEMTDSVIVDLDAELAKERERSNLQMEEMKRELYSEMNKLNEKIEKSEKRMMEQMKENLREMIQSNKAMYEKMETSGQERADAMFKLVSTILEATQRETRPPSPPRKQLRTNDHATPMEDVTLPSANDPASPQNLFQYGKDARAGEHK